MFSQELTRDSVVLAYHQSSQLISLFSTTMLSYHGLLLTLLLDFRIRYPLILNYMPTNLKHAELKQELWLKFTFTEMSLAIGILNARHMTTTPQKVLHQAMH